MSPVIRGGAAASRGAATSSAPSLASPKRATATAKASGRRKKIPGAKVIIKKELPAFSRQLAAMLAAGMPIVASLEGLRSQIANANFKMVVGQVKQGIENGLAFSEALKVFPSIFDELYINMVRGGESGGQLAETMARIADFLENSARLRRKVKSAMSYPVAVMCIAGIIAVLMMIFIVPVFKDMFEQFGGDLPTPTKVLCAISDFIRDNFLVTFGALALITVGIKKWKKTKSGQLMLDKMALKFPVVGGLVQKVAMARFARTFSQLIHSGVPILTALDIVSGATGNKVVEAAIARGHEIVEKGEPLSNALAKEWSFTPILVHMMAAGEKTGKIDEMMDSIAVFYEEEVDAMLSGLTALIEPLLMVFLGVVIGGIVVCMFLPIFKMGELVTS
ncbi:MAG: type II secretion system F family protein [Lentisphaerales bacterium]|jgi:type IV pilus assembly protein PilC|nr:MAG: type II secretion system F family protein [Lentisphaerales bacterium]